MIDRIFNLKIPSLLGIVMLLAGVGLTSFLVDQGFILEGRAAPEKTPANIAITNVSPTSFTVMYTTSEPVTGSLSYGTTAGEEGSVALDDRDRERGGTSETTAHHITVQNLTPDTTYFFSILSGGEMYTNEGEPYTVTTAPQLDGTPPEVAAITGSVILPNEAASETLLVLFSSDSLQARSTLVQSDGTYTIPLSGVRTQDLSAYASLSDAAGELVILNADQFSHANVLLENTNPVPAITFGQSYDFRISTEPLSPALSASGSAGESFSLSPESTSGPSVDITSPEEAETFTDQQPVFSGTGIPGESVDVAIHSEQATTGTVTVEQDGTWEFRPPEPLNPGNHTITIKTRDLTGTLREFTRSFTVYAQGSQFIEPSVSPTRTPTPTIIEAEPTATPTPTTPVLSETPTPTPTLVASTIITGVPTPTSPPPVAGPREIVLGGILGAGTLVVGLVLFFLARGSIL